MARPKLGEGESKRLQMVITEEEVEAIDTWQHANRVPSRSEAMSLVALEAGITGLPVLLTNTCGFDEVQAINGGRVVEPTAAGISGGLEVMFSEIDDLTLKGQRLKSFVIDHYSWHVIVTNMVDYFEGFSQDN